jgi:hypothetical protein
MSTMTNATQQFRKKIFKGFIIAKNHQFFRVLFLHWGKFVEMASKLL